MFYNSAATKYDSVIGKIDSSLHLRTTIFCYSRKFIINFSRWIL